MIENKTLDFKFEIKQLDEDGTIEGYGAVFGNRDSHHDIIERGAFTKTLMENPVNKIKMLWQHRSSEPIGKWLEIREDERGLYCKGKLLLELTQAKEVYKMLKGQLIDGMSIGYSSVKDIHDEDGTRILKEVDLWEISIVTFPSNRDSLINSVKSVSSQLDLPIAPRDSEWNKTEANKRIRELTDSKDKPSDSYKNYFMQYDVEDKENFGAYKLPFADVIDGKAHIIPNAVFAIVGDGRKESIKEKINALYKRFRMRFEDNTLVSPFEDKKSIIESWELKEFDKFLKSSSLTNSEIKIFRKRYLELHPKKEEVKTIDEKKDVDDKKNKKSLEEINDNKKSPEEKKEKEDIQKTIPEELSKRLKSIVKDLQNI